MYIFVEFLSIKRFFINFHLNILKLPLLISRNMFKPLGIKVRNYFEEYDLQNIPILPRFYHWLLDIFQPTFSIPVLKINLIVGEYPETITPPAFYRQLYASLLESKYVNRQHG